MQQQKKRKKAPPGSGGRRLEGILQDRNDMIRTGLKNVNTYEQMLDKDTRQFKDPEWVPRQLSVFLETFLKECQYYGKIHQKLENVRNDEVRSDIQKTLDAFYASIPWHLGAVMINATSFILRQANLDSLYPVLGLQTSLILDSYVQEHQMEMLDPARSFEHISLHMETARHLTEEEHSQIGEALQEYFIQQLKQLPGVLPVGGRDEGPGTVRESKQRKVAEGVRHGA